MEMGMGMMKKMMARMGPGGDGPMGGKMGEEEGPEEGRPSPPMGRMMEMCEKMLSSMDRTTSLAAFATPELQEMFREWMESLEAKALGILENQPETDSRSLASALGVGEESAIHIAARLALGKKAVLLLRASGTVPER
jgi:hypothetical protein